MLETIKSGELAVYAVWEPILRPDDERSARKATTLLPDARVHHYWIDSQAVGVRFQQPIGLKNEPAWDVYLVYPPGVTWSGEVPPTPDYFMHQLGGRLPEDRSLDAPVLAAAIARLVPRD